MIILGIDPGTANTGYGVIKVGGDKKIYQRRSLSENTKNRLQCLGYGCIKTDKKLSDGDRLKKINNDLSKLIKKYKPDIMSVENVYFFKNWKTVMPVGQAKGVILLTAAKKKVPVYEITPLEVKMTVVGYGRADKKHVQKMVARRLNLEQPIKSDDAADALGIAICGALKKIIPKGLTSFLGKL